jgi:hypothetical protein
LQPDPLGLWPAGARSILAGLVPCLLVNCGIFRGSQGGLPGALNLGQHGRALGAPHVAFGLQVVTSQVLMERIDQLRDAAETAGQNRLLA